MADLVEVDVEFLELFEDLEDTGAHVGSSNKVCITAAKNWFKKFLLYMNQVDAQLYPHLEYDPAIIRVDFFTQELFGKYATFLTDIIKVPAVNSAYGYMSKMKKLLRLIKKQTFNRGNFIK